MNNAGSRILECLVEVERERARRRLDADLLSRVQAIKSFQHARFSRTYADLLRDPSYANAALFFLNELYGPHDFSERDRQFERVVPALVRLFTADIVETVQSLAELHRLSEMFDGRMAAVITGVSCSDADYAHAWRTVGDVEGRLRQIDLTVSIGNSLTAYTRRALMRHTLRAMRRPAQVAGLGSLQHFLELGFDTFKAMPDPRHFLDLVAYRERTLATALFNGANSTSMPAE